MIQKIKPEGFAQAIKSSLAKYKFFFYDDALMFQKYDYDLFVIGGGSGGIRAARWSANLGAKVALCEEDRLGGTCVIRGCIPKKLMVYGSSFKKSFELAKSYGWDFKEPKLDWEKFNQARSFEIDRLEAIYNKLLTNSKVKFISGRGSLKSAHEVEVQGQIYTARYILIAVGAWPYKIPIEGSDLAITSNELFSLKEKPKSLLVIGAGYIGLEFASIFQELGVKTSVMFRKANILGGFDKSLSQHLQEEMEQRGISMLSSHSPSKIEKKGEQYFVTEKEQNSVCWSGDLVLMATGRKGNIESLNLKNANVDFDSKKLQIFVNPQFQTSCPSIYAIGDCSVNSLQLTPVATSQGMFVSENLFSKNKKDCISYDAVPSAVFTQPEVGTVGLSEEQALEQGFSIKVFESKFRPLKLSLSDQTEKTYMKLVVCKKSDRVLGCHLIGDAAAEILQGFAVAVKNHLTLKNLQSTIGIHPSSAEEFVTMRTERKP